MTFCIMRIEAETLWGNSRARQKSFILPYKEEIVPNLLRVREYTDRDYYFFFIKVQIFNL